jgi:hypothetical protein
MKHVYSFALMPEEHVPSGRSNSYQSGREFEAGFIPILQPPRPKIFWLARAAWRYVWLHCKFNIPPEIYKRIDDCFITMESMCHGCHEWVESGAECKECHLLLE